MASFVVCKPVDQTFHHGSFCEKAGVPFRLRLSVRVSPLCHNDVPSCEELSFRTSDDVCSLLASETQKGAKVTIRELVQTIACDVDDLMHVDVVGIKDEGSELGIPRKRKARHATFDFQLLPDECPIQHGRNAPSVGQGSGGVGFASAMLAPIAGPSLEDHFVVEASAAFSWCGDAGEVDISIPGEGASAMEVQAHEDMLCALCGADDDIVASIISDEVPSDPHE